VQSVRVVRNERLRLFEEIQWCRRSMGMGEVRDWVVCVSHWEDA
jgi:hypothetical protein